ncbi:MAG: M24 family metallopeptidase [Thomasclavelia ramosa]
MLLIDSGGQYLDGTIDTTRTFVLSPISDIERRDFTVALKAMFRLSSSFLSGNNWSKPRFISTWYDYEYNLDYRCGTGHGVGHFLTSMKDQMDFRPHDRPGFAKMCAFEPGMI